MATAIEGYLKAGTVEDLTKRGCTVVTGGGHTIAVFYHQGQVYAVDNRCPHMGFPLAKGTVKGGILTCHWHHARFDLCSGGTFDPFADDVRTFPVTVSDGEVWVKPIPPARDETAHWSTRLREGIEHGIRLVIAKSVLGLEASGADYRIPLSIGARFGTTYSVEGWGAAMSILTCMANVLPQLAEEDRTRALYQGLMHVSLECAGKSARFAMEPLPLTETRPELYKPWFRDFIEVRDSDGAERCLRSAIEAGLPLHQIADMVYAAATDHIYVDGGHIVDFATKAFELLDHIGWEHAGQVLTSLVRGMAFSRRSQELNSWRHPVDIASMVWEARSELPALYKEGQDATVPWNGEDGLVQVMLEDDPAGTLNAIKEAVRSGATAEALGSAVAYAAFLRMARFHTSNEFGDWDTVHNTLTAANALHQALKRAPSMDLLRAIFDTSMSIYLDRFLNTPAQRMPETGKGHADAEPLLSHTLESMDVQQQVEQVADQVSSYLTGGGEPEKLVATLGHTMLREDAGFHSFQIVDAGFRQYLDRWGTDTGRHVLIAMARFLAAHSPTPRAVGQTYQIALRLHRGEEIFRDG